MTLWIAEVVLGCPKISSKSDSLAESFGKILGSAYETEVDLDHPDVDYVNKACSAYVT